MCVATVLQQDTEEMCESQSASPDLALIYIWIPFHCIQGRALGRVAVKANAPVQLHREWDSSAPIATASLVRVVPWNVIADTRRP